MKKMLSLLLIFLFTATICLFAATCSFKKETIKIGAIISLTGASSHLVEVRDGMMLAVDEINEWGGVNGRKLELIVEDSKSDPEEAKKVFEKIESTYHPLLYVSTNSSVSMALAPLAKEHGVVLVGVVVSDPELSKQNDWVFRYYTSSDDEAKIALYLLEDLKAKEVGILYQNDEYGRSVYDPLKAQFEKTGGIVQGESFDTSNPIFGDKIGRLKDMEAIYVVAFANSARTAIEELKKSGYKGSILAVSGFSMYAETTPEANGVNIATSILYHPDFILVQELKKKYETRYGKPLSQQAATGYDFIKLLPGLLEEKELSRESVRKLLSGGLTYPGVFGDITVKPGGHDMDYPLYPARIVDGKIEYLR